MHVHEQARVIDVSTDIFLESLGEPLSAVAAPSCSVIESLDEESEEGRVPKGCGVGWK